MATIAGQRNDGEDPMECTSQFAGWYGIGSGKESTVARRGIDGRTQSEIVNHLVSCWNMLWTSDLG